MPKSSNQETFRDIDSVKTSDHRKANQSHLNLDDWAQGFEVSFDDVPDPIGKAKQARALSRLYFTKSELKRKTESPYLSALDTTEFDPQIVKQANVWHRHLAGSKKLTAKKFPTVEQFQKNLKSADQSKPDEFAFLGLISTSIISAMARYNPAFGLWWPIVDQVVSWVPGSASHEIHLNESSQNETDRQLPGFANSADDPLKAWRKQVWEVEIPLSLYFQLPMMEPIIKLIDPALQSFADQVAELLDHDGWPHTDVLPVFGPLMASWARCRKIIYESDIESEIDPGLIGEIETQLSWAAQQFLRLLRADRTMMMGSKNANTITESCFRLIRNLSDEPMDKVAAKRCWPKSKPKKLARKKLPAESSLSEWGESGVLQTRWDRGAPKIAFDYSNKNFQIEIGTDVTLIAGSVLPAIRLNDETTQFQTGFEVVCDEFEDDLDYIELEAELRAESVTAKLTRQIILNRNASFLIVADIVIPQSKCKIDYRCQWPLAGGIDPMPETETREVYLTNPKIKSLVLPLALPEWKNDPSDGRLVVGEDEMTLSHQIDAEGLYTPLLFDLYQKRASQKRTWRQLTVVENRLSVPSDAAAAFRFQLNKQQWFFYRTVSSRGNRTFLGENFNGEFVFNRFDCEGEVTELLRIV